MEQQILGLHHITAIAGQAQRNYDFYAGTLGLRLVKKTVNFDDPGTYHFYFGDEQGTPGTILTFFPWTHVKRGTNGVGMATEINYSVPAGSFEFWKARFSAGQVTVGQPLERLGEQLLPFRDPDGLLLNLVVSAKPDGREPWVTANVTKDVATRGFHSVVLTVRELDPTANVLTSIFGYRLLQQEGNVYRFITDAVAEASMVDVIVEPNGKPGINAGGTNHHVAFRVKDENALMYFREKVLAAGLHITPKIDRNYFFSLYFREPGGVLFEIATDNPGFTVDEELGQLGANLKLPAQYEPRRDEILKFLPELKQQ